MPTISTADFKGGITLSIGDQLLSLVEFQHVNPGKGAAFVRTKLKNVKTGAVLERTFRAGERLEQAVISTRKMQLLYQDSGDYVFMDSETYDQVTVPSEAVGESSGFILPSAQLEIRFHDDEVIGIQLPASVVIGVAHTDPGVQGDRVSGATKQAVLETGLALAVPLFVNEGDQLIVDTRTGAYISRA